MRKIKGKIDLELDIMLLISLPRLNTHVKPLIWVESVIERHAHSRVEIMVSQSEAIIVKLLGLLITITIT